MNFFQMESDSISETLMDKLNDLTASSESGDRIINRITICKGSVGGISAKPAAASKTSAVDLDSLRADSGDGLTLGISIVQGSDNKVYVKDLVKDGPGARHGIQIGDQVSNAVQ